MIFLWEVVYIYGAGRYGQRILKILRENRSDIEILGFIDTYTTSGKVEDLVILNLLEFEKAELPGDLVIIGSSTFYEEMERVIKSLGYRFITPARYGIKVGSEELEKIKIVEELLVAGREIYRLIIDAHINGNRQEIKKYHRRRKNRKRQYLDYVDLGNVKTAIDGGLFEGDTALKIVEQSAEDCTVFGFDPWGEKFLKPEAKNERIQVIPMALWSRRTAIYFYTGYSENFAGTAFVSGEPGENRIKVNAISLDEFVKENRLKTVDFIKLDIEGAEIEALKGAQEVIRDFKPQMAVSVYHYFSHLYEIPLLVMDLGAPYKLFFEHYSSDLSDSVMYFEG